MTTRESIRELLDRWPGIDPHEFATVYVDHVESPGQPMGVERAFRQWVSDGTLTRSGLRFSYR